MLFSFAAGTVAAVIDLLVFVVVEDISVSIPLSVGFILAAVLFCKNNNDNNNVYYIYWEDVMVTSFHMHL